MNGKRVNDGVYEYKFTGGLTFHVVRIKDADYGSGVQGKWYWINAEDQDEGGDDHYHTKRQAVDALIDYVPNRHFIPPYGWCYVPDGRFKTPCTCHPVPAGPTIMIGGVDDCEVHGFGSGA